MAMRVSYAYNLLGTHEHPEENETAQFDKKKASEKTPVLSACTKKDKGRHLHIASDECAELATSIYSDKYLCPLKAEMATLAASNHLGR